MSDMGWLKDYIDERIAESHKETSAAPNTVHSGVVVDRYGHVVNTAAGAGGASPLIAFYEMSSNTNRTGGSKVRVNFNSAIVSHASVTTGASWNFIPPADGTYAFHVFSRLIPTAAFAAGEKIYWELWSDAGGSEITSLAWEQFGITETTTRDLYITDASKERYCLTTDAINIRIGNGTGNTISQRGSSDEVYSTAIAIYKL